MGPGRGIEIVPYSDRFLDETLAFLARWNPDHPELADRAAFTWQRYVRRLALLNGRVVGHVAQVPQVMRLRGSTVPIGWGATLVLDSSNPVVNAFAGSALLDHVTQNPTLTFAAVGIMPGIETPFQRRGLLVTRSTVRMYSRPLRPAAMLDYLGKPAGLAPALRLANLIFPQRSVGTGHVKSIERFDPGWDTIWDRILADRFDVYCARTAEYLNYKLSQPHKQYRILVHTGADGHPDGYVVYRHAHRKLRDLRLMKLADLVGTDSARVLLLSHAVKAARESDAAGIVALGSVTDSRLYSRCGLWARRAFPVVLPLGIDGRMNVSFFDSDLDDLW